LVFALNVAYALWVRPNWEPSQRFLVRVPYYLTYTANWFRASEHAGPALFVFAWSLCTEEQFYAFWAPLLRYTKRLSVAALGMVTIVGFDLLLELTPTLFQSWLPEIVRTILTSFACPIGLGALLSMVAHHPRFGRSLVTIASQRWAVPIVLALTLSVVVYPWLPLLGLHGLFALLVLVCSARKRHALAGVLNHAAVAFVGRISYGIYLWHVAVIGGLKALFPALSYSPGWLFLLALPLSIVVASLSYEFFEKPWLTLARRYKRPTQIPLSVLPSAVDGAS
jgi:peptidoglycan/LPS O-acetylase OafA/YrhL